MTLIERLCCYKIITLTLYIHDNNNFNVDCLGNQINT